VEHYGPGVGEREKVAPVLGSADAQRARLAKAFRGEEILLPSRLDAALAIHSRLRSPPPTRSARV
jgi:hypothetical protein